MQNKRLIYIALAAIGTYGIIYFYQRYKRQKANESVVTYDDAIKTLESI